MRHGYTPTPSRQAAPALLPGQAISPLDQCPERLADRVDVPGGKGSQTGERQVHVTAFDQRTARRNEGIVAELGTRRHIDACNA